MIWGVYALQRRLKAIIFILFLTIISGVQIISQMQEDKRAKNSVAVVAKAHEYCIFIEIEDKTLYLLKDGVCIKEYPISSGKSGLPSPLGFWKITEKSDWGEGFGGRWMGLNVP